MKQKFVLFLFCMSISSYSKPLHHMQLNLHLGDGEHSEHFMFIKQELKDGLGSAKKAQSILGLHKKALKTRDKSPLDSILESEFSNLLEIIRIHKKQLGITVFNKFGQKIGIAGKQTQPIVLDSDFVKKLEKIDREGELILKAPCPQGIVQQKKNKKCISARSIFRPVWDYKTNQLLGYSEVITKLPNAINGKN